MFNLLKIFVSVAEIYSLSSRRKGSEDYLVDDSNNDDD